MKKLSFTLIELIIVIIVISILIVKANFTLADTSLNEAADQIITHINYARHLALNDNKFQYYPLSNSKIELNKTKYWFKQWWQIRFSKSNNEYWYEVFSDVADDTKTQNFDKYGKTPKSDWQNSWAMLNNKYLVGYCGDTSNNYPSCNEVNEKLNLTKYYGIKKIEYINFLNTKRLIFDNYGNVYLDEGLAGDQNDINPYDKDKRVSLTKIAKIKLCKDDYCNNSINICVTPKIGFAYLCK